MAFCYSGPMGLYRALSQRKWNKNSRREGRISKRLYGVMRGCLLVFAFAFFFFFLRIRRNCSLLHTEEEESVRRKQEEVQEETERLWRKCGMGSGVSFGTSGKDAESVSTFELQVSET